MNAYIALLRGVNVGGKNKLPMAGLRELFAQAGCSNTRTYIQSGNVVFQASNLSEATAACRQVEAGILERFGCKSPILLRSAEELQAVARSNSFLSAEPNRETDALHVVFLADAPEPSRAVSLDPERSPGDQFAVIGREIYLSLPRGVAETKLTIPYLDSQLKTTGTQRSWRTILALAAMAAETEKVNGLPAP